MLLEDKVTVLYGSDRKTYMVIDEDETSLKLQRTKCIEDFKPLIVDYRCINWKDQKWIVLENNEGEIETAYYDKDKKEYTLKGNSIINGWYEWRDYGRKLKDKLSLISNSKKYIIMDFEFNSNKENKTELFQIGALKLDENFEILDTFNLYIRPDKIVPSIKNVNKMLNQERDKVQSLGSALNNFNNWIKPNNTVFCWGISEKVHMVKYLKSVGFKMETPLFYNIQNIYAQMMGRISEMGLKDVMDTLGIGIDGNREMHDAVNDCYYVAEILKFLNTID